MKNQIIALSMESYEQLMHQIEALPYSLAVPLLKTITQNAQRVNLTQDKPVSQMEEEV